MQRSVIGKNEQRKSKQLTTPKDPQTPAFMESLLCKAAKCTPYMALDASFSQEATLDSSYSWTSSCFDTPQRRGVLPGPWEWLGAHALRHWETYPMPAGWMEGSAAQEWSVQLLSTPGHAQPLLHLLVRQTQTHCSSGRLSPADARSCPWALPLLCWRSGGAISGAC